MSSCPAAAVRAKYEPLFFITQLTKRLQREKAQCLPLSEAASLPDAWDLYQLLKAVRGDMDKARERLGIAPGGEQPSCPFHACVPV